MMMMMIMMMMTTTTMKSVSGMEQAHKFTIDVQ